MLFLKTSHINVWDNTGLDVYPLFWSFHLILIFSNKFTTSALEVHIIIAPIINYLYFVLDAALLSLELKISEMNRIFAYYEGPCNAILNSFIFNKTNIS